MVYNVTKYDGSPLASVQDSTLDTTSTSIALIGRNAVNYGLALNENFVAIMQNFAGTNSPPQPQQGQIWYDTISSSLKVWDGNRWLVVTPPFDGNAGTATVAISPSLEVILFFSAGQIVATVSHQSVSPVLLPDNVKVADVDYQFKPRFPNGLSPGMTMAQDANAYKFVGTATKASTLETARIISLGGSATGNVAFDGGSNVVLVSNLINVLNSSVNTSTYWSKLKVSSNGLVTDANVIVNSDVTNALGYTPPSQISLQGHASGNSLANASVFTINVVLSSTNVSPGSYSNVTVDSTGRVISGNNDSPVPVKSIVLWDDILVPNGWAVCDGQSVLTTAGTINTPNLVPFQIGPTRFIMRVG